MRVRWKHVRAVVGTLAGVVVGAAIIAPFGQFFISWADEQGWYAHPSARFHAVINALLSLTGGAWFHWIGGAIVGFAVGAWLDTFLGRPDDAARATTERWLLPADAIAEIGPPGVVYERRQAIAERERLERDFEELNLDYNKVSNAPAGTPQDVWNEMPEMVAIHARRESLGTRRSAVNAKIGNIDKLLTNYIRDEALAGSIIARGYRRAAGQQGDTEPTVLQRAQWLSLSLHGQDFSVASGDGILFSNLEFKRP